MVLNKQNIPINDNIHKKRSSELRNKLSKYSSLLLAAIPIVRVTSVPMRIS